MQLSMRCDEEAKNTKWIACQKRKRRDPVQLSLQIKKALVDFYHIAATAAPVDPFLVMGQCLEPSSSTELPTALVDRLSEIAKGSEIDRLRINEVRLS
ncbi:hypothetical protein OESDEN_03874 [Oesophagostomum dentatum]|uniref:Uncharacterized protein n=1 Tax=Oesophagostomum dentatum TaxID=61180 RepID=A0A0B1TF77_OESDE|nr:hypothetical protein OESDEN_03874 [Oesophagostomum dentatum]